MLVRTCDRCGDKIKIDYGVLPGTFSVGNPVSKTDKSMFMCCKDNSIDQEYRPIDLCDPCAMDVWNFIFERKEKIEK